MRRYFSIIFITLLIACGSACESHAREIKFELSLDRNKVAIGDKAQLGLSFYGTQSMPAPDLGNPEGLEIRYIGPSSMMTVLNGQISTSITHRYSVQPLKVGRFQLGPYRFSFKGDDYISNMVFLEASEDLPVQVAQDTAPLNETLNLDDRIFLVLNVDKPAAYVNELIPVTVKLYVNRLNVSDIQLPTFAQEGFSKVDFKEPRQFREQLGGLIYDVLEFKTSIFATRAGDFKLGPAKIKCNVMVKKRVRGGGVARDDFFGDDQFRDSFFEDFFTRFEKYPVEIKSKEIQLVVSPLPTENVPQGYSGAIGDYQFIYSASPGVVKAGDPVTVRMDINGNGNFNTVLCPKLEGATGFKVYEPQVKTEENRKLFVQVLIPDSDKVTTLPKATFSYFDPVARQYKTLVQGGTPLTVEKGKEEAPSQVVGPAVRDRPLEHAELAKDIIYIKESPGNWSLIGRNSSAGRPLILLVAVPFILVLLLFFYQKRSERMSSDTVYAGRIIASKAYRDGLKSLKHQLRGHDFKLFYETMFKTLQEYIGNRIGVPSAGVTSGVADSLLVEKGIDKEILKKIRNLFEVCDMTRFASIKADGARMQDDMKYLDEIVRYLEKLKI